MRASRWLVLGSLLVQGIAGPAPGHTSPLPASGAEPGLVAYTTSNRARDADIFLARDDGGGVRRLVDGPSVEALPAFSPDGAWVAFVSDRDGPWSLYRIPVEGGPIELLYPGLASADGSPPEDLVWAPDGERLVITLRPGSVARAYALTLEGGELEPITGTEMDVGVVRFGLRGRRIYMRRNLPFKAYTSDIWSSRPDGSDMRRITHMSTGSSATGTSDHPAPLRVDGVEKVAFHLMVSLERSQIFLMSPDGSDPRNVSRNSHLETMPVSSPCVDGELVIQSDRTGSRELWRIRVDGSRAVRLTDASHARPRSWWAPPGPGGCR